MRCQGTPVRPLTLRRRRSRVPWIYLLYHRERRPPETQPSCRRRNAGTSNVELRSKSGSVRWCPSSDVGRLVGIARAGRVGPATKRPTRASRPSASGRRRLRPSADRAADAARSTASPPEAAAGRGSGVARAPRVIGVVRHIHRRLRRGRDGPRGGLRSEAGRDDGDLHLALQRRVDDRAEDDVGVLVGRLLHDARRFAHLDERQVGPAGDVDDDAARAVDRRALEQRARNRAPRRFHRAVRHPRRRPVPIIASPMPGHDRLHVGEVEVDQARAPGSDPRSPGSPAAAHRRPSRTRRSSTSCDR